MNKRKETISKKTLEVVRENPGLDGLQIAQRYHPAGEVICSLEKAGLIRWENGWKVCEGK